MADIKQKIVFDDFKVINPSMKATSETRLSDIEDFYRKHLKTEPTEVSVREII